jgi:Protein of unknown function (DUF2795)
MPVSEQGSGTHGPVRDDAIKREEREEIRELAEEWPEPEDEGEEADTDATWAPEGRFAGQEYEAIEMRSDLARHLDRTAFPATRERLLEILTAQFAEQRLLDLVSGLPEDQAYDTVGELARALGLPVDEHRG